MNEEVVLSKVLATLGPSYTLDSAEVDDFFKSEIESSDEGKGELMDILSYFTYSPSFSRRIRQFYPWIGTYLLIKTLFMNAQCHILWLRLKFSHNQLSWSIRTDQELLNRALHFAILPGNLNLVRDLVLHGADICACDVYNYNYNSWVLSVIHGHVHLLEYFSTMNGCDLFYRDFSQDTLFNLAVVHGHVSICEWLIRKDVVDMEAVNKHGRTSQSLLEKAFALLRPMMTTQECYSGRERVKAAWVDYQIQKEIQRRRNEAWARRWPFVQVVVCHDFQPLLERKLFLEALNPPLPPDVPIPPLQGTRLELLRNKILTHPGLWRLIAAFL
jgi:hypothetical protein